MCSSLDFVFCSRDPSHLHNDIFGVQDVLFLVSDRLPVFITINEVTASPIVTRPRAGSTTSPDTEPEGAYDLSMLFQIARAVYMGIHIRALFNEDLFAICQNFTCYFSHASHFFLRLTMIVLELPHIALSIPPVHNVSCAFVLRGRD